MLKRLTQRYCKNLDIKLVFPPYKIKNLFSAKDAISKLSRSHVIYAFSARHTDISLHVFVNIKTIVFSSASYSCCYLVFIYSMKVRFYITPTSGSFVFATEVRWMLVIRNMLCKFKTVCFYLKVISCLLLVRKFSKKQYIHMTGYLIF